ncbi:MAG: DNA polymerase III subunit delta' [bacterium]
MLQKFNWSIVGHEKIVNFLQAGIEKNNLSHAYIFYGAKHLGKTTVARFFAKSILCAGQSPQNSLPCGKCANCRQFENKIHPDLVIIKRTADSKTGKLKKNISIEQIKETKNRLSLSSFLKSYKIVIIEEAEKLSLGAANSLLKTLEEPKGKTVFILIADQLESMPKTIISRCQKIKFLQVSFSENYDYLVKIKMASRDTALSVSDLAHGKPGLVEYFLEKTSDEENWREYNKELKNIIDLISQDEYQRIEFINAMLPKKIETEDQKKITIDFLNKWRLIIRDLLMIKNDIPQREEKEFLKQIAQKYKNTQLINLLDKIKKSRIYLESNVGPKLILENFVLAL